MRLKANKNRTVYVMMSTYNGEKYIAKQIESILYQKDVSVELHIRDDGSNDSTVNILEKYETKCDNITLYRGHNLGCAMSFLWLVAHLKQTRENSYYSFSDQDDVWDDRKLISAIELIENSSNFDKPAMYYSDLRVVDSKEHFIRFANDWESEIDKFMILMFIGIRGCTIVYNEKLHKILLSRRVEKVVSHDTFIALVAYWTGTVIYDRNAYISYRQTGDNVSITGVNRFDKLKQNLSYVYRRLTDKSNERQVMAIELLKFSDFIDDVSSIQKVAYYSTSFLNSLKLFFDKRFFRLRRQINIVNRLLIFFRKL